MKKCAVSNYSGYANFTRVEDNSTGSYINNKKEGTKQKEIKSANESISFPNSLDIFNFLAILPSIVSKNAAIKIK